MVEANGIVVEKKEVYVMKKIKEMVRGKNYILNGIASLAIVLTTFVANRHCAFIFHQAEAPEMIETLRKS